MAASNFIPFGTLLNRFRRGPMSELDVYHGTPHRFPATEANPLGEFDASKIGTGEGAQAYGHGVYYAENPEVAKGYQPRDPKAETKLMNLYKQAEARQNYDQMEVLEAAMLYRTASELAEQYPQQKSLVNRIGKINEKAAGSFYKADLPDDMIDRMLDWDKPFLDQSDKIKKFARENLPAAVYDQLLTQRTGDMVGELGKYKGGSAKASKLLQEAGIPGIRYLDRQSRIYGKPKFFVENVSADGKVINSFRFDTREEAEKFSATFKKQMKRQLPPEKIGTPRITEREAQQTTSNFVVFPGEEKKVKILERK
jgi:hypothetical protein